MSDDLRPWVERLKIETLSSIERGYLPRMNAGTLVLLFDKLLTRIEALEAQLNG